jgi:hypothetical protein
MIIIGEKINGFIPRTLTADPVVKTCIADDIIKLADAAGIATDALLGNDEYCMNYLQAFRSGLFNKN